VSKKSWIVIPNWDKFQHYKDRTPNWVKTYLELLHNDAYLSLTGHCRGVLHGLWLVYASSCGQVTLDTRSLSRQLGLRVTSQQLESLNQAGFIRFRASKPLALEKRRVKEKKESAAAPAPKRARAAAQTPFQAARDWVLLTGWQLDDADLNEMLGSQFGIEGPLRGKLAQLAGRVQTERRH
jgi:hypothetical protein